jgi:hypothetical protein
LFIVNICKPLRFIHVDPGPTNRGPTSLLALKILTPVTNTGKLRSIGQMPVDVRNLKEKNGYAKPGLN